MGRRRRPSTARSPVGTVVALAAYLTRLYAPLTALSNVQIDVMTALVSFDRVFEVLDLPPMIQDAPDAAAGAAGPGDHRVRPRRLPLPDGRGGLPGLARVGGRRSTPRVSAQVLFDVTFTVEPGPAGGAGRPVGGGQDHHQPSAPPPLRRPSGSVRSTGSTSATPRWRRCTTRSAWSPRTPTCSTRHPGEPALRPTRGHRGRARRGPGRGPDRHHGRLAARRARHRGR